MENVGDGQLQIWRSLYGFVDIMMLRCAIQLGVADVVHAQGEEGSPPRPLSVESIASRLPHPPSNLPALRRVMRCLARRQIFSACTDPDTGEILYGPTPSSAWLLQGSSSGRLSLVPLILFLSFQLDHSHWSKLSESVARGEGTAHKLVHGMDLWEYNKTAPESNKMFNNAMTCFAEITLDAVLAVYKDKFASVQTLVDVGGGTGTALGKITRLCPHLRGINFDLPHVVAGAPEFPNVVHVAGSIFQDAIPHGDAIFMEGLLHSFNDEQCLKILRSCRRALPEKTGKLIIVDVVLEPEEEGPLGDVHTALDVVMLSCTSGGERTEEEWKMLLGAGGFPRFNIIKLPALLSIIEAYPPSIS